VQKYKYEKVLTKKANEYIKVLGENYIIADIQNDSIREFSIKVELMDVTKNGDITIYYSPKRDEYKIVVTGHEGYKDKLVSFFTGAGGEKEWIYKDKGIEIDVDGSFRNEKTAYAFIIRKDGKEIKSGSGLVEGGEIEGGRQIAGELMAAVEAIKWCSENKIKEVRLYYDYNGIRKWALGEWKAKKSVSQNYQKEMKKYDVKILFVKIKSHTGAKWNELVDKLAEQAINYD